MKINLYISLYDEPEENRLSEFIQCLNLNIRNSYIDRIFVLNEGLSINLLKNEKLTVIDIKERPKYSDFFPYFEDDKINIISNSDIYFDRSLNKIRYLLPKKRKVFLFTRYENNGNLFNKSGNSHDSWLFFGKPLALKYCNYFLGIPNCEQRLAAIFADHDYYVLNPSRFIKTHHLHKNQEREYLRSGALYSGTGLLVKPLGFVGTWLLYMIMRFLRVKGLVKRRTYLHDGSVFDQWQ